MNYKQLEKYKKELKVSIDKIIREEIEMIFLSELAQDNLGTKLVFYGGTALRLAYDSPRFSEDIDLITKQSVNLLEIKKFIKKIEKKYHWHLSDFKNKRQTIFALFKINDEKLKHPLSLKIEIHKTSPHFKLNTELRLIKSPVSVLEALLLVPSLKDLKRLKEEAIMDRKKARDIFDLWYICQVLRVDFNLPHKLPNFKKRLFLNELQVFLPFKYKPLIHQLYEQVSKANKQNT